MNVAVKLALALGLSLGLATAALPQATPLPPAKQQFLDNSGRPLASGKVYHYVPSTSTGKSTWQNFSETTLNANPVILDAGGRAVIFGQGNYRQVLKTSADVTIYDANTTAPSRGTSTFLTDALPIGALIPFTGTSVPTNWLLSDGSAVSRTTYASLLSAITITDTSVTCVSGSASIGGWASTAQMKIGAAVEASCLPGGTTVATIVDAFTITVSVNATASGTVTGTVFPYGNGNGSTTFNLPNLSGRVPAGRDNLSGFAAGVLTNSYCTAAGALGLGSACGSQSHTMTAAELFAHTHTAIVTDLGHTHGLTPNGFSNTAGLTFATAAGTNISVGLTATQSATTGVTVANSTTGSTSPFSIVQPTLVVNYIIKYASESPSGSGGVISFGGLTGDILCGAGLTCDSGTNSVSISSSFGVTGPGLSTTGNLASWGNSLGSLLADSGVSSTAPIWLGTNTIMPSGLNLGLQIIQAPTGTTTGNVSLNSIAASPDSVATDGTNFVIALNVGIVANSSSVKGGREAIQGYTELRAATNAANSNRNYVGVQGIATATASDGGTNTGAGALGAIFGGSWFGYSQNTATNFLSIAGGEINFALQTGSSAKHKAGLIIAGHTSDAVQGATTDAALVITNQANFGLNHGILFSDLSGFLPIKSTGTIIGTTAGGTAAHGIDLSGYTFSSDAFKSTGFSVNGLGKIAVSNLASTGGIGGFDETIQQTSVNTTDTNDAGTSLFYTLLTSSASNQLVARVYKLAATNTLTGGGLISSFRALNIATNTSAGAITDANYGAYVEQFNSGTVNTGYGFYVAAMAGTTKWGFYDATTSNSAFAAAGTGGVTVGSSTTPPAGGVLSLGDVKTTGGNLVLGAASKTVVLKQGANGSVGTFVCNGATPVTVTNSFVAVTDVILFGLNTVGGTVGAYPSVKTITAATGFTVACTAGDTSTMNYAIIKNAA